MLTGPRRLAAAENRQSKSLSRTRRPFGSAKVDLNIPSTWQRTSSASDRLLSLVSRAAAQKKKLEWTATKGKWTAGIP